MSLDNARLEAVGNTRPLYIECVVHKPTSIFPSQYHSTIDPYSSINLLKPTGYVKYQQFNF